MGSGGGAVRVIHRHRIGERVFMRVSRLTYVGGKPAAVLTWLHLGEGEFPGTCVPLDQGLLTHAAPRGRVLFYGGLTVDPRYERAEPLEEA